MANGYEIRHMLLVEARNMLFEGWHEEVKRLQHNAGLTNTPIGEYPPQPSVTDISKLAEQLYEFVQRK